MYIKTWLRLLHFKGNSFPEIFPESSASWASSNISWSAWQSKGEDDCDNGVGIDVIDSLTFKRDLLGIGRLCFIRFSFRTRLHFLIDIPEGRPGFLILIILIASTDFLDKIQILWRSR